MSKTASRMAVLARVPLFAGLERHELEDLASLMKAVTLRKGDVLCKEGEPGDTFYLIERGELEVRAQADAEHVHSELDVDRERAAERLRRIHPGEGYVGAVASSEAVTQVDIVREGDPRWII